jgi:hypothetical protein
MRTISVTITIDETLHVDEDAYISAGRGVPMPKIVEQWYERIREPGSKPADVILKDSLITHLYQKEDPAYPRRTQTIIELQTLGLEEAGKQKGTDQC